MKKDKEGEHPRVYRHRELVEKTVKDTFPANDPPAMDGITCVVDEDKDVDTHRDGRTHSGKHR